MFSFQECTNWPAVVRVRTPEWPHEDLWGHPRTSCIWSPLGQDMHTLELKVLILESTVWQGWAGRNTLNNFRVFLHGAVTAISRPKFTFPSSAEEWQFSYRFLWVVSLPTLILESMSQSHFKNYRPGCYGTTGTCGHIGCESPCVVWLR